MATLQASISAIKALAAARQRAIITSHQMQDVLRACIHQTTLTAQAQCLCAIANFDSLAALKAVFVLQPALGGSGVMQGLVELELYYGSLFERSDPERVVKPLQAMSDDLAKADLAKNPHDYLFKLELLQTSIVDTARQVLDGSAHPVNTETFDIIEKSFVNLIKTVPSQPTDEARLALDTLNSAFRRASDAQQQMIEARKGLLEVVYSSEKNKKR